MILSLFFSFNFCLVFTQEIVSIYNPQNLNTYVCVVLHCKTGTCKMRNEIETKCIETKRNLQKRNEIETKRIGFCPKKTNANIRRGRDLMLVGYFFYN
jgi:hypothetical protein